MLGRPLSWPRSELSWEVVSGFGVSFLFELEHATAARALDSVSVIRFAAIAPSTTSCGLQLRKILVCYKIRLQLN